MNRWRGDSRLRPEVKWRGRAKGAGKRGAGRKPGKPCLRNKINKYVKCGEKLRARLEERHHMLMVLWITKALRKTVLLK